MAPLGERQFVGWSGSGAGIGHLRLDFACGSAIGGFQLGISGLRLATFLAESIEVTALGRDDLACLWGAGALCLF